MKSVPFKVTVIFALLAAAAGCMLSEPDRSKRACPSADRRAILPIPVEGSLQNPAWSPDGGSILFTRFRSGYNRGPADLFVYDLSSGEVRILVSDGSDNVNLPGSSWDGATDRIVFSSSRAPHDEIYVIAASGKPGDETRATGRADTVAYEPVFSADGAWILFESHPLDVEESGIITTYSLEGAGPYRALSPPDADSRQPNASPDGRFIVYQALFDRQWDLWLVSWDGSDRRRLTAGPGDKTDASFSPDGARIVYSAGGPDIEFANLFTVPVSGGEPQLLTCNGSYDGAPSWSPDGSRIVFESTPGDPDDSVGATLWMVDVPAP